MKIWEKAVYQLDTSGNYVLVPEESVCFEHDGPVALCGGGSATATQTAEQQQQLAAQNEQYEQQLMNTFNTQFAGSSSTLNYLQGQMQNNINNPQGYTPQQLASMRTSSDDTLSNQYQSAQQTLNAQEDSQGSRDIPSGVNDQLDASLVNSEAQAKSAGQNQITQANANLQQQNYWNSVNALSGVAGEQENETNALASEAEGMSSASSSAGNSTASNVNANTSASTTGLAGVLGGVTSGIFGAAGSAGGFGKLFA